MDPVSKGTDSGVKRVPDPVKRDQMLTISGPGSPGSPGPGLPGPIQHYPGTTLDGLWLPGQTSRRYGNRGAASLLRTTAARTVLGPLSPEPCFLAVQHRVRYCRCCAGCRVLYGVYPAWNGMGLAGHLRHYYRGTPPPPSLVVLYSFPCNCDDGLAWLPVSRSVLLSRPWQGGQESFSSFLLCQLRPSLSSSRNNNNIIIYYPRGQCNHEDNGTARTMLPQGQCNRKDNVSARTKSQ